MDSKQLENLKESQPVSRNTNDAYEELAEEFYKETGVMAPGKDMPAEMGNHYPYEERLERWCAWIADRTRKTVERTQGIVNYYDHAHVANTALPELVKLDIRETQKLVHETAREKGWWEEEERNFGELMMLAVTELAEAFEDWRNGRSVTEVYFEGQKPCGIPIEFADVFIRLMDNCEKFGIDLASAIHLKMLYNATRPYRHGGKKA